MPNESVLNSIPSNTSLLQPSKFTFLFPTLPFIRYFAQTTLIPGVSTTSVTVSSPFANMYRHGDKLVYDELTVNAIIDEDLRLWEETYNWLISLTKPQNFEQYKKYTKADGSLYHDAILTINTNSNNPNVRIKFRNCHPTSLGAVNFDVKENADVTLTADVVFRYDYYEIERVNG